MPDSPIMRLTLVVTGFHLLVVIFPILASLYYWRPHWKASLLATFLGMLTGYFNMLGGEVQFTALLLMVFGFFLGTEQSPNFWPTLLGLAIWVPLGELVRQGPLLEPFALLREMSGAFFAFAFAFLGLMAGRAVAKAAGQIGAATANSQKL